MASHRRRLMSTLSLVTAATVVAGRLANPVAAQSDGSGGARSSSGAPQASVEPQLEAHAAARFAV
jgi:hypothetical protein